MPATVKTKEIGSDHPLFVLNFDHVRQEQPEPAPGAKARVAMKVVKVYFTAGEGQVLILSDTPDDKGKPLSSNIRSDALFNEVMKDLVTEEYAGGAVTKPAAGHFKGDHTKPLPLDDGAFSLVLGRAIVCFCGTTTAACGIPSNLDGFLKEVIRVLKPGGAALLHGDAHGGERSAQEAWDAAVKSVAPAYDESIVITLLRYGGKLRGIKVRKKVPAETK